MTFLKTYCLGLILLFVGVFANAQTQESIKVEVTYAEKIGITAPLRSLAPLASTSEERRKQAKLTKKFIPNFLRSCLLYTSPSPRDRG